MKKILNDLRELVWPMLEPPKGKPIEHKKKEDFFWSEEYAPVLSEYLNKYRESEENRKKDVESKSTIFIGTFGVASAVLMTLMKDLIFNSAIEKTPYRLAIAFLLMLSIVYLCKAIWFSIKALERQRYFTPGYPNFLLDKSPEKRREMAYEIYRCVERNKEAINYKVDQMTMAQEFFKRSIFVVAFFAILISTNYIFTYKSMLIEIAKFAEAVTLKQTLVISVLLIVLIQLFLNIYLYRKGKKHEEKLNELASANSSSAAGISG